MSTKKVIDVSQYQSNINYAELAKNIDGMIIRVGYRGWGSAGTLCKDSKFQAHVAGAENNKIPYGFYFFSQAVNAEEGKEEAEYTYNLIKSYNPTYPIYIDSEDSTAGNNSGRADKISNESRTAALVAFCKRIEELGYIGGVYASENWFKTKLNMNDIKKYSIWCANYGINDGKAHTKPSMELDGWQFTSRYTVGSISSGVDMSYFYKDFSSTKTEDDKSEEKEQSKEEVKTATYYANYKTGVNYRETPNGNLKGTYKYGSKVTVIVGTEKKVSNYTWIKTNKGYWVAKELLSKTKPNTETSPFVANKNYSLTVDLKVRSGAGTNYPQKTYNQLTVDGRKHAYKQNGAVLKRGTIVTVTEVIKKSSKEYWGKIPSGYIALMYNGSKYVK